VTNDFEVVASSPLLSSFVFDVERRVVAHQGSEFVRDVVTHRGAVAILCIDTDLRVATIRQYRVTVDAYTYELPAGTIEIGETDTLAVAKRELAEEIGVVATVWRHIGTFFNSPGWTTQRMFLYAASAIQHVGRQPHGPEELSSTIEWWHHDQVLSYMADDSPKDGTTSVGLLWYLQNYA